MNEQSPPNPPSISALNLETSEEITLYKELIRILERDIDEIKEGNAKSGWTSWAIMGGLVGAFSLLFGELRGLSSFPTGNVAYIVMAGMTFTWFARSIISIFGVRGFSQVRPGKIRWSSDLHYPALPFILYTLAIQVAMIGIAIWSALPLQTKIPALVLFTYNTLWSLVVVVLSMLKFPIGGGEVSRKTTPYIFVIAILLSGIATVMLGTQLPIPLGETAGVAYKIGGLITAIILLVGTLIRTMAPTPLLNGLQDLKNDIIFLRVDIDQALKRYETLTEGETLPDALKEDLASVINDLDFLAYAHANMATLLTKIHAALNDEDESPEAVNRRSQELKLDGDSFILHEKKCNEVLEVLQKKLTKLNKKQARYAGVAEDWAAESSIRTSLSARLQAMQESHEILLRTFNELKNPPKLPPQK
jgi:hypothetical protein